MGRVNQGLISFPGLGQGGPRPIPACALPKPNLSGNLGPLG